jgi:transcription initiation factor TFIIIB Brf1 subunit/transcription initiation factor TFIIB
VSVSLTLALNIVERHSRSECIRIINGIAIHFRFNGETRDTAIQIADAFAEKASDRSCQVAKLVAAASCILASKLLDTKHLKMVRYVTHYSLYLNYIINFTCEL